MLKTQLHVATTQTYRARSSNVSSVGLYEGDGDVTLATVMAAAAAGDSVAVATCLDLPLSQCFILPTVANWNMQNTLRFI